MIKSKRLTLRALSNSDWELISFLRTNPKVNQFVKRSSAPTRVEALDFIKKIHTGVKKEVLMFWIISLKSTDESIGTICLWNYSNDMKTVELGYDLKPEFHRKGYMSESIKVVVDYAFKSMNFKTIEAYTHQQNEGSVQLLLKNNFSLIKGKIDDENSNNIVFELNDTEID